MGFLRAKLKNRPDTKGHQTSCRKQDVKQKIAEHLLYWGRETVQVGTDANGKAIMQTKDIPKEDWIFEYVTDAGLPNETVEPITLG